MTQRILIVDDSATVRQQLGTLLRDNAYEVVAASDGQLGLEAAGREAVDLMIVDVNMPVMNGIDMIKAVRQLPHCAKIPIFMLTTEATKGVMALGKNAGATAWIIKPFRDEILLKGVARVLTPAAA